MFVTTPLRSVQRIISLPITHAGGRHSTSSTISQKTPSKVLTYYHFQVHLPHRKAELNEENDKLSRWNPQFWAKYAQTKAVQTWSSFGEAPEGSWKLRVFRGGEAIVDRIDFEELALKGIDPSLGPTILRPDFSRKDEKDSKNYKISLLFPPSIHTGEASLSYLRSLVQMRAPRHKRGFWIWLLASPFTAPFMLIPVIPNLPFFFCIWRSWSHYRAYRASEYLTGLIEHGQVTPEASPILDAIYRDFAPKSIESSSTSSSKPRSESEHEHEPLLKQDNDTPRLLLNREAVPAIISACNLKQTAAADIHRALEQAKQRLAS